MCFQVLLLLYTCISTAYIYIYIYVIRSAKRDLMGVKIRNSDLRVFLLNIL